MSLYFLLEWLSINIFMYFSYGTQQNQLLPFHYEVKGNWLSTSVNIDNKQLYGYKLGSDGGNFVEFETELIKFSYHKDFKLKTTDNYIITNLDIEGNCLHDDIIEYHYNGIVKQYSSDLPLETNYIDVVNSFKNLLLENIKTLVEINTRIVYTAGLDSSLIAFLAHAYDIDFTTVIQDKYNFFNLPFKKIEYASIQKMPEFLIPYGLKNNVKPGFYQPINNNLITGYYGDLCALHHNQMYHQSKHMLKKQEKIVLYDKAEPENYPLFNSKDELFGCIKYLNLQNYFRHWFENFQILDPYRDPRLFFTLCKLNLDDLIIQLGTGNIQKQIIEDLDSKWLENICDFKNNYDKFK